ncbi:MAG: leucine-rich repeat protein, partial [Eubacteriales bacterium]
MKKFKKIIFLACFVMLIAVMAIAISAAAPESIDLDTANLVDKDNNAITIESVVDKDGNTISPKEEGGTVYALPLYDADGNALSYYLNSTTLTAALSSTYFTASSSKIGTAPDFVIINWQHDYFNSTTTTPDLQNKTKLKYVWLNENTKTIYGYGFKQTGLAEITIPSSVTEIKTQAFLNCYCLKTVNLAENGNLTTIGEGAFNGCKVLETIDLTKPAALTTIGANAFKGNTALTGKIVIPSTVTTIGSNAFQNCTAITEINIPSSVTSMGGSAFYGCTALYTVDIAENGNIKSIGDSTFYNCKSLTIIDLSKFIALQTIESNAFRGAFNTGGTTTEQIKEIVIPATVTTIGDSAFNGCKRVLKVILSRDLTSIGNTAFSEADALVEMDFSQCTKDITIGNTLFNKSLKTLNLGPTKVTLDTETGSFKSGSLATVIMSYETFANLGAYAFNSGSNTTFYIVGGPDGITGSTTQKAIIDLRDAATTAGNNAKITAVTDDNVVEYEYGNTSYTGSCIVFNYNLCVAFYGGEHTKSDAPILA